MSSIPLGRIVWYQLNATDLDKAIGFYTDVIGWNTEIWSGGDGDPYMLFNRGATSVGGAMSMPAEACKGGAPQHWLMYVSTPDVDKSVLQAQDNGAQVHLPPTDLDVGRFAVIADPQTAAIALYAPEPAPEDTPFDPQIGDASWHELITTDHDAAMDFYGNLFGWEKTEAMDMGELGTYQMFGRHGKSLGGMFSKAPAMPAPPHWLIYFRVKDVRDRIERIEALGGTLLQGPTEVPGGDLVIQCLDPQGGVFALHSTT